MADEKEGASEGSSVRDDIMASIAELEADAPEAQTSEHEPESVRSRDEHGRFSNQSVQSAGDREPQPVQRTDAPQSRNAAPDPAREPAAPQGVGPATAPVVQAESLAAAPASWSNPAKAKWAALDPELRAEINKREADIHKGFTKMDDERHFAKEMQRATAPYEAVIRAAGVTIPQAVEQVLNTAYILRTADPATKLREIQLVCQQYGVDPRMLAQPQQQQNPQVQELQQRLARMESDSAQRQQAEKQQLEQQVLNAVETFGQDPKHPHFKSVSAHMGALMQAGAAKDMDEAYEMAVWARPDLRSQLLAEQNKPQVVRQKTEKARAKAVSVRGGPGGYTAPAQNPNMSVRESLMAAVEEVNSRL